MHADIPSSFEFSIYPKNTGIESIEPGVVETGQVIDHEIINYKLRLGQIFIKLNKKFFLFNLEIKKYYYKYTFKKFNNL